MNKDFDFQEATVEELGAIVSKKLKENNIDCILVGNACVAIYSQNLYQSTELHFVTFEGVKKIKAALKNLHFHKEGKYFSHPHCKYTLEFFSPPVLMGDETVTHFEHHKTALGTIKMLTPMDSVKDRLIRFCHEDDGQSLEQALAICKINAEKIDISEIKNWAHKEGFSEKFEIFLKKL